MDAKRPYQKPVIERVSIVGEMQATSGCKTSGASNTKQTGKACNKSNACKSTIGS